MLGLILDAGEDMWHAYNLIRVGDIVTASTFRKIQRDVGAGSESEKVKLKLSLQVEDIDFDPEGDMLSKPAGCSRDSKSGVSETVELGYGSRVDIIPCNPSSLQASPEGDVTLDPILEILIV